MFAAPDVNYLNLTVQGGVNELVRHAGTYKVQWIVKVSAYPIAKLVW